MDGLQYLKLSTDVDSKILFKIKIDPYLIFKNEGDKIYEENRFFFQNIKNYDILSFDD